MINLSLLFGWNMEFAVRMKLAKTNWMYLELSLRKSSLLNLFVFTVSCCYLLFIHFTFLKNQYTIVENKGASSVKLSGKLDLDMRTKFF